MVAIVEQNAEAAVQQQKAEVVSQAKYAIDMTHQQKDAVVQEAEELLSQKSSTIHYLERRFEEAQFCYTQAEGNFKHEISTAEGNFMQIQGNMETRFVEEHSAALQHIQAMTQREGQLQNQWKDNKQTIYHCEILNSQLKVALLQSEQTTETFEAQANLSKDDRFAGLEDELRAKEATIIQMTNSELQIGVEWENYEYEETKEIRELENHLAEMQTQHQPKVAFEDSDDDSNDTFANVPTESVHRMNTPDPFTEPMGQAKPEEQKPTGQLFSEWAFGKESAPRDKVETAEGNLKRSEGEAPRVKEADVITLQGFPSVPKFKEWKKTFKREVASASGRSKLCFAWISKVDDENIKGIEDLEDDGEFESVNTKLAAGLHRIFHGEFHRKVNILEDKAEKLNKMLNGRQLTWLMYQHFKASALGGHIYDFKDLCLLELKGDNIQGLVNDFEATIEGMADVPNNTVLEWFLFIQLEASVQFEPTMALHKLQMTQQGKKRDYDELMSMVKNYLEEQRREKIRKDKDGKTW
jgi:hypothetical protein